jgi:hypothetical protein
VNYTYTHGHPTQTTTRVTGSATLTSKAAYNANGTVSSTTDANGAVTNYHYDGTGGCNNLLLTSTVLPIGSLSTSQQWNCNGGVLTQATDENNQPTGYGYVTAGGAADPYWRVLSTTDPLGNVTWNAYTPATSSTFATQERFLNFNTTPRSMF